jgi:cytochrome c oxidase cbb3-type subunit 3
MESMNKYRRRSPGSYGVAIGVCLLVSLLPLQFSTAQEKTTAKPNPMANEDVQRGMSQFKESCAMCHGSEARGASGPDLIESSLVRHDANGDLIGDVLRNGRPAKGMPSFSNFSAGQISDIVAFLHAAVSASDNRSSGGPARGYALEPLLTGNLEAGKQFFNGQGRCATCHSPTGDLKGVAKKYSPRELEGQLLYPSIKSRTAVVSLRSGEKVKGELLHLDQFYVSVLDASGNYRSFPLAQGVKVDVADPLRAHMELLERYNDKEIHDVFAYLETLQ